VAAPAVLPLGVDAAGVDDGVAGGEAVVVVPGVVVFPGVVVVPGVVGVVEVVCEVEVVDVVEVDVVVVGVAASQWSSFPRA